MVDFEELVFHLETNELLKPHCRKILAFFASKACRGATMIGDPLTIQRMNQIVKHMAEIEQPWNCPHGRPTMRLLTYLS